MQKVISFLKELHDNNNREWFLAHKAEYNAAKKEFDEFALDLLREIRTFDPSIGDLSLGDITYRIYRDVRFSKNKMPYKCHMGVFICPGGKKSGYSGYYFQVSAADDGGWESGHMMAAGNYLTEQNVLNVLREDIAYGEGEFRDIISQAAPEFTLDFSNSLKKLPAGFPAGTPDSEFFRLKSYCLIHAPSDEFVNAPDLARRVARLFRTTKPFIGFVNRAITYVREEQ